MTKKSREPTIPDVVDTLAGVKASVDDVKSSIDDLRSSMEAGFSEVHKSLHRLEKRVDHSLLIEGKRSVDHERRITRLETLVARLKPTG